jgi:hypothetical protein
MYTGITNHVPTVKGKTTNERQMIMWADAKAAALHGLYQGTL